MTGIHQRARGWHLHGLYAPAHNDLPAHVSLCAPAAALRRPPKVVDMRCAHGRCSFAAVCGVHRLTGMWVACERTRHCTRLFCCRQKKPGHGCVPALGTHACLRQGCACTRAGVPVGHRVYMCMETSFRMTGLCWRAWARCWPRQAGPSAVSCMCVALIVLKAGWTLIDSYACMYLHGIHTTSPISSSSDGFMLGRLS